MTGDEIQYLLLGEHSRTVRKPRRLGCGGYAQVGWHIRQQAYLADGEFVAVETCQRCIAEEHGYEFDGDRHGNVTSDD